MASLQLMRAVVVRQVGIQQLTFTLSRSRSVQHSSLRFSSDVNINKVIQFDTRVLQVLACPLSKKPLRYDEEKNELVCDELGVAYSIVEGIPNLNPRDGRMIGSSDKGGCEPSHLSSV